jgi:hypothetical protein
MTEIAKCFMPALPQRSKAKTQEHSHARRGAGRRDCVGRPAPRGGREAAAMDSDFAAIAKSAAFKKLVAPPAEPAPKK